MLLTFCVRISGWGRGRGVGGRGVGGREIVPTTTGSPILQPEALYCNQKLDPTTTEQLFTQKGSLLQLEPSILFGVRLCRGKEFNVKTRIIANSVAKIFLAI